MVMRCYDLCWLWMYIYMRYVKPKLKEQYKAGLHTRRQNEDNVLALLALKFKPGLFLSWDA